MNIIVVIVVVIMQHEYYCCNYATHSHLESEHGGKPQQLFTNWIRGWMYLSSQRASSIKTA